MLIRELNARKGTILPRTVRQNLCQRMQGKKGMGVLGARDVLLNWTIGSMPMIAEEYGVKLQVIDGIQHYRFGFVQAENLIRVSNTDNFAEDPGKKMIALFTSVHDIGRMMVGSGASVDRYPGQSNFLHPVVGAMMLREAFEPVMRELANDIVNLLNALVTTAERHTLSIGLTASQVEKQRISEIEVSPYHLSRGALLMADVEMGKYGKYAHLVPLADLINNPSIKGLTGVSVYDSLVGIEEMTTEERIEYLIHGPGNGEFQVIKNGEREFNKIVRLWRNKPSHDDYENWRSQMRMDAIQFLEGPEIPLGEDAFAKGLTIALG